MRKVFKIVAIMSGIALAALFILCLPPKKQ